jgi:hypothetical protein
MPCKSCGSDRQNEFDTEINIHFPGLKGMDLPAMLIFPRVVVCLDCGFAEFTVPETELHPLAKRAAA